MFSDPNFLAQATYPVRLLRTGQGSSFSISLTPVVLFMIQVQVIFLSALKTWKSSAFTVSWSLVSVMLEQTFLV